MHGVLAAQETVLTRNLLNPTPPAGKWGWWESWWAGGMGACEWMVARVWVRVASAHTMVGKEGDRGVHTGDRGLD